MCGAGCRAGGGEARPAGRTPFSGIILLANVAQQFFRGLRGRMILAACAGQAQAREEPGLGHGVFTNYVLRHWRDLDGLPPSGRVTFGSLVDYVGEVMPQPHRNVGLPVYNGVGVGGTFVLRRA